MSLDDASAHRRFSLPAGPTQIEGTAIISREAEVDQCFIVAPTGRVTITGHARLSQCVIIEPCTINGAIATAAILGGQLVGERGMSLERAAQQPIAYIGPGSWVAPHADVSGEVEDGASIGRGTKVEAGAIVATGAVLGEMVFVGVEAKVSEYATVGDHCRIEDGALVYPYVEVPPRTVVDEDGGENIWSDDVDEPDEDDLDEDVDAPPADDGGDWLRHGGGNTWRGHPRRILSEYRAGTDRSWVLVKLARLAASSEDGRISKKLIAQHRPDLLEHAVVKEVLRAPRPLDAERLNDMSWSALSPRPYDVYFGRKYHTGLSSEEGQMLGPRANDVFVFAVPHTMYEELAGWQTHTLPHDLFDTNPTHPDAEIPGAIGWVRVDLYPPTVVVVEIQSDRDWMSFRPDFVSDIGGRLRQVYFKHFAADALNIVVEWAFTERYKEVWVLDSASRRQLGGSPPRDFYDKWPKRYTPSPPMPLPPYVETYKDGIMGRRIRPNG